MDPRMSGHAGLSVPSQFDEILQTAYSSADVLTFQLTYCRTYSILPALILASRKRVLRHSKQCFQRIYGTEHVPALTCSQS